MKKPCFVFLITAALGLGLFAAGGQEKKEKPAGAEEFAPPKPGPEHEILKQSEGVWDASGEFRFAPDATTVTSKGAETNTLAAGGLWLITDYKGDYAGMPFQGHGVDGYDTLKKKYVGSWVDSMATYLSTFEGTYDRAAKTLTMWTETPGPSGKLMKWRGVTEFKDKDTRIWTAYMPDPQGKEFAAMKITYKRRK